MSRAGTNMSQADYERLENSAYKLLSETEARALINKEFGFEFSQIEIICQVDTYELDETGKYWEKKATHYRQPQYESTDWNYIRFNVRGWRYEFINGDLYFYEV